MPNSRKTIAVLSTLMALSAGLVVSSQADAKSSTTCIKAGSSKKVGVNEFRCAKSKGKLTWIRVKPVQVASQLKADLTVFGAASLTSVLPKLGEAFQKANPGVKFAFNFAGSSTLAQQIIAGAPADLFFSAGPAPMASLGSAGDINGPASKFTSNSLVIAVPRGNPARIFSLADLGRTGVKFLICAPQVPCGNAAAKVLSLAKIVAQPVSLENDVKSVLMKVAANEADAGLVYRTDITSDVIGIDFPESSSATNEYPAAVIHGTHYSASARAFLNFVLSPAGQAILKKDGFGTP
jgi:molybdate transport system substrate-binding protein